MIEALEPDAVAAVEDEHRAMWGRVADGYASGVEPLTAGAVGAMLDAVEAGAGTALLDVGTGPGTVVGPALGRGAVVSAIDLSPAMIEQAQARHPGIDAQVANAAALPFEGGSFDAVTLPFSLHHMATPATALAEAHRVLRDGGRIACTVWAPDDQLVAFGLAYAALGELSVEVVAPSALPLDGAESPELVALLSDAGFVDVGLRELPTAWDLADPSALVDLMDRLLSLGDHGPEVQREYAAAVERNVRDWSAASGTTVAPNPARLITGRKPG